MLSRSGGCNTSFKWKGVSLRTPYSFNWVGKMPFCPNCGKEVQTDSASCANYGKNLVVPGGASKERREVAYQEAYGAMSLVRYAILFQLLFLFIVGIVYFSDLFSPSGVASFPFDVLVPGGTTLAVLDYFLVYRRLFSPREIGLASTPSIVLGLIQLVFGGVFAGVLLLIAHGTIVTSKSKVQEQRVL